MRSTNHARRVLCIEDDGETLESIAKLVTESGYEVLTAHSCAEGLAKIAAERPDLVLCQADMPCILGFATIAQLRASAVEMSQIPFIFLTDREPEGRRESLGFDDYVTRPIDFERLLDTIRTRLAKHASSSAIARRIELNASEVAALLWSARGKTSEEIAAIMDAPKRNINFFIENACRKLGAVSRIQAVAIAVSQRIIRL